MFDPKKKDNVETENVFLFVKNSNAIRQYKRHPIKVEGDVNIKILFPLSLLSDNLL